MASVDYWEYESQGLGLTISMMVIATLSVILRFVARAKKKTGWGADDWMIIPSLLCFYGFTSVNIWDTTQGGIGITPDLLPPPLAISLGKAFYIEPIFSVPAICFAKLSILCLYYRIFFVSRTFCRWTLIVGATVVIWMIACTVTTILHCLPQEALWNPTIPARCINFVLFFEIIEPINCLQDVVIALMPFGVIKQLHLDLKQKISIGLIFSIGNLVAVISLIRIVLIANPTASPDAILTSNNWLVAQLCMAILCANFLTYRPLLPQHLVPSRISTWFSCVLASWRSTHRNSEVYDLGKNAWPRAARYNNIDRNGSEGTTLTLCVAGPESQSDYPLNAIRVSNTLEVA